MSISSAYCLPFYGFHFGKFEANHGIVTREYIYVIHKYKGTLVFSGEHTKYFTARRATGRA